MHMTADPDCDLHITEFDFLRVIDNCEKKGTYNYWLAPLGATGMDAHFVLDLGCRVNVQRVELKNTYNMESNERYDLNWPRTCINVDTDCL